MHSGKSKVISFLTKYKIPFKMLSAGRECSLNCLWHDDYKNKLSINVHTGLFQCFVCGEKGRFIDIAQQVYLKKRIATATGDDLDLQLTTPASSPILEGDIVIPYPEGYFPLFDIKPGITDKRALSYLHKRGITDAQIFYYKLGHCVGGILDKRVIVPILNVSGALLSYIARDYTGIKTPKVLTPPTIPGRHGIKDYVFNLHNAAPLQHILIGEGVFDAIKMGPRAVCLFGKTASSLQIAKILNVKPQRISIVLDPDAKLEANRLALQFVSHVPDVRICYLPEGVDAGAATPLQLKEALSKYITPDPSYIFEFLNL